MEFYILISSVFLTCQSTDFRFTNFKLSMPPCLKEISVFDTSKTRSKISCAKHCTNDGMCDTLIWDLNNRMCMLHSESSGNNDSHNVTIGKGWLVYALAFSGCVLPGYDYFPDVNRCIKPYSVTKTWQDARVHCQGDGADLITITSAEIRDVVFYYSYCRIRVWVGMRQGKWLNGEPFVNIFGPNTLINNEDLQYQQDTDKSCGTFIMTSPEMKLIDDSCNIRKRSFFLCEIVRT